MTMPFSACRPACRPRRPCAEDRGVVRQQHARIGHEHLVAGDALVRQPAHFRHALFGHVGDDHVEGIVDGGPALGLGVPVVERGDGRRAAGLNGEIDNAGGAAEGRGAGAGLERVRRLGAAERHLHMRVRIDAAWNHQLAGGVDHPIRVDLEIASDDVDGRIVDEDIGPVIVVRRDHAAVLDQYAQTQPPPYFLCVSQAPTLSYHSTKHVMENPE